MKKISTVRVNGNMIFNGPQAHDCRRAIPSAFGGHLRVRGGEHGAGLEKLQVQADGRTIEQYDYPISARAWAFRLYLEPMSWHYSL
jgi:hypothetical protein